MRLAVRLLCVAALIPAFALASSAFSYAETGARAITVALVGDAAAYLAIEANSASPFDCVVTEQTSPASENGKLKIDLSALSGTCSGNGGGTGINAGGGGSKSVRYAFHDLLQVTNKGTNSVLVWVNSTPNSGSSGASVHVAKHASTGQMTDSDSLYMASNPASVALGVGEDLFVGVRVMPGTLTSGTISGTVDLVARSG